MSDRARNAEVWTEQRLVSGKAGQSCDSSPFSPFCLLSPMSREQLSSSSPVHPIFSSVSRSVICSFSRLLSMDAESQNRHDKPFACDVCDHRFTTTRNMQSHKQAVHGDDVGQNVATCARSGSFQNKTFAIIWSHSMRQTITK